MRDNIQPTPTQQRYQPRPQQRHNVMHPPTPTPRAQVPVPQRRAPAQPGQIETLQPVDATVRAVELPFFDSVMELLPLSDVGNQGVRCFEVTVPRVVMQELAGDTRDSFHIFLRLFHCTPGSKVLSDSLPNECVVVINEMEVRTGMPPVQHNPYPNMPKRYHSRPVDLSYLLRRVLNRPQVPPPPTTSFRVMLQWDRRLDKRWAVGVWAVRRVSVGALFNRVMTDERRAISKVDTMRMAHRAATGDGEGLKILDAPSISLLCPYTTLRMHAPVRSVHCYHLQCFDLRNYLSMNEKNPRWKCPVCGVSALHSELRVDELVSDLVTRAGADVKKVELTKMGRWRDSDGKWEMTVDGVLPKKVYVAKTQTKRAPRQETINVEDAAAGAPTQDDDIVLKAVLASDIPSRLEKMVQAAFGVDRPFGDKFSRPATGQGKRDRAVGQGSGNTGDEHAEADDC